MDEKYYDIVVIGSGDAGKAVAFAAAKKGKKVAVIDKHPLEGTGALQGCTPQKMLVTGAEIADCVRRMNDVGVRLGSGRVSWKELQEWKQEYIHSISKNLEKQFHKIGIDTYQGVARFIDETSIRINKDILHAKTIHISAGSKPAPLSIQGAEFLITSDEFLNLIELPKRIIFIGGGYISFELAHIAARAGSEVMILHRSAVLLKEFDPDLVDLLVKASEDIGIMVNKNRPLVKVEKHGSSSVVFTQQEGREIRENADLVVHCAGRIPDIDDFDLSREERDSYFGETLDIPVSLVLESYLFYLNQMPSRIKSKLLPQGYKQRRQIVLSYKVLRHIINQRKGHKLPEWSQFIDTIHELVYHPELLPKRDIDV